MTWPVIGLALVGVAVAYAWGRWTVTGAVVVVEVRCGDGGNWRWFGLDASGRTVCSGFPHRFVTEPMARDAAGMAFPGVRCRREGEPLPLPPGCSPAPQPPPRPQRVDLMA